MRQRKWVRENRWSNVKRENEVNKEGVEEGEREARLRPPQDMAGPDAPPLFVLWCQRIINNSNNFLDVAITLTAGGWVTPTTELYLSLRVHQYNLIRF